jgi:hypothetical protein
MANYYLYHKHVVVLLSGICILSLLSTCMTIIAMIEWSSVTGKIVEMEETSNIRSTGNSDVNISEYVRLRVRDMKRRSVSTILIPNVLCLSMAALALALLTSRSLGPNSSKERGKIPTIDSAEKPRGAAR